MKQIRGLAWAGWVILLYAPVTLACLLLTMPKVWKRIGRVYRNEDPEMLEKFGPVLSHCEIDNYERRLEAEAKCDIEDPEYWTGTRGD